MQSNSKVYKNISLKYSHKNISEHSTKLALKMKFTIRTQLFFMARTNKMH